MNPTTAKVAKDDCDKRHRNWRRLAVITAALVGSAPVVAYLRANNVDTKLQVHIARQDEHEDAIAKTLARIEAMQEKIFDKVVNGK